ncbi:hypothetical protein KKE19_03015 [Patescibacteria group bacterium]|nr:hypothetical protein [Patescibacteria group bacterium]MBU4274762.1 hypothetical protein [Patescibacteria group bacterium]MBU4368077.1 hypothetical protein [Patescibacteria group bacterium]MBU4462306.1 hypothetical protein [Patescibacteria group bacterium]MCG2700355.1 hypothetical protein [Candidatus Parcubacteria bacterium]
MFKNISKSSGQIAKVLLALAVVVLVAILIAYIVIKRAEKPPQPVPEGPIEPLPMYETTLGDIKFMFLEATDKGSILSGKDSSQPDWQKDLYTTERFIELIIGAQNVGKENTLQKIWDVGEIIDSEGREFISSGQEVANWLPQYQDNLCGSILRPSFEPSPCKKIYEVAKISTGLKVRVFIYDKAYSEKILEEALLDIKLMP